jgi:phage-related protein
MIKNFEEFINENRYSNYGYENSVNEGLFNRESEPEEPKVKITADFIRENSAEKVGDVFAQTMAYAMAKFGYNVGSAIDAVINGTKKGGEAMKEGLVSVLDEIKSDADATKKFFEGVGSAIVKAMKGGYEFTKKVVTAIPNIIVSSIGFLIKLGVSGFDLAKDALKKVYSKIVEFVEKAYEEIKDKLQKAGDALENAYNSIKDKIYIFTKVCWAILLLVGKKVSGAAEAFGDFIKKIFNDAKEKVTAAVMIAKEWLSTKADEVKNYVKETAGDIADGVKEAWNSFSRGVRKAYEEVTDKLADWMNDIKVLMNKIGEKISDLADKAGDKLISVKDATASAVIKKGVKALNKKNYPLDKVIDMVTNAYNESLYSDRYGNVMLNENLYNFNLSLID